MPPIAVPIHHRCPLLSPAVPSFSYLISKDTWLEAWPLEESCQDADLQPLCQDFTEFSDNMVLFGCPT